MQLFITAIFSLGFFVGVAASCPNVCSCTTNSEGVYVDCESKGLDSMPSDLPKNTYKLRFHNNVITEIDPSVLRKMTVLRLLFFNNNEITSIDPTTFQNMNALSQIHLEDNRITAILSESFKDLPNLVTLHLHNNKISVIEDNAFNNLTSLRNLYLHNNIISVIEDNTFNNLPSLTTLHLDNNNISVIEDNAFNNLTSLRYLYLYSNKISVINDNAFNNLPSLTTLYLHNNKISVIEDNAFNNLPSLRYLYLHNNIISVIEDNAFNNLTSLTRLKMGNNNISFVSNKTFENLPQLSSLNFDMYCGGCDNIPFWRWLRVNQKFSTSVICNDYSYSGTYLANVQPCTFSHCFTQPRLNDDIPSSDEVIRLKIGMSLNLTVYLISIPTPTTQWTLRRKGFIDQTLQPHSNSNGYKYASTIYIQTINSTQFGSYIVSATNDIGNFSRTFYVIQPDHPTAPVVVNVVCQTTSAVILWRSEINGGSKQEFYVQYWRISQSSSSMLSPSIPDPGITSDPQYAVNNLIPETLYIFQIITRNDYGDAFTKSVNCTTDQRQILASSRPDSNGLFAAGISGLVIGLLSIMFAVSLVVFCRFRLKKKDEMRSNNYTEFQTCTRCNPVVTDSYDSLETAAIGTTEVNENQTDRIIATYEEVMPSENTAHTNQHQTKLPKGGIKKQEKIYDNIKV